MEKKRIYRVAKEFHVSSEALLSMLKNLNYEVKSHMSVVSENMYKSIKKQFEKQHDEAVKEIQKKKKISEAIDKKSHFIKHDRKKPIEKKKPIEEKKAEKKSPYNEPLKKDEQIKVPSKRSKKKNRPIKVEFDQKYKDQKKSKEKDKKVRYKARKQLKMKEHIAAVHDSFKKTIASMSSDSKSRSKKSRTMHSNDNSTDEERLVVKVSEYISVAELATQMGIPANTIIAQCLSMGHMVSINQRLDMDTIILLADEFGYDVEQLGEYAEDFLKAKDEEASANTEMVDRPPVVTVMGHVDHGKTSLLDYIRKSNIVSGESGGITQHIGAYSVTLPDSHKITFIDTPGHEAFTAMRARGAKVTDIVILIVAADDSVMPQTIEAINHAKAANVPIIIAINKIDLANADPEKIKGDLARHNILVEDWGGKYQCQEISAKKGINIDKLLEKILLESEMLELKAIVDKKATGVVIDSKLDKGRGAVATILIKSGTMRVGDSFVVGLIKGRVRAMLNEHGEHVSNSGPALPVLVFGMDGVPKAGDTFYIVDTEVEAKEIAQHRRIMKREQDFRRIKRITLSDIYDKIKEGSMKEINLIIKADVDGSMEAISDILSNITHEEVRLNIIHQGVGGINENDVLLASVSGAIILGFHVRPTLAAKTLAEKEQVEIKLYKVIYEIHQDMENALKGLLSPKITEKTVGTAEVRDIFKIPKIGTVAGCYITSGKMLRNGNIRLIRNNIEIYDGKISTLKRFKEDVTEVSHGYECGLSIDGYNDIKVGDTIEVIEFLEEAREL